MFENVEEKKYNYIKYLTLAILTVCCILLKLFPCELKACSKRTLSSMLHSSAVNHKHDIHAIDLSNEVILMK